MLKVNPNEVAQDAKATVVLVGPPRRAVLWTLTGPGTLEPSSAMTDETGRAYAIYTPGIAGDTATITATYGS